MTRSVDVVIGEDAPTLVGTVRYEKQGHREHASFAYDAAWLANPARFALGPTLPLGPGPQFHRRSAEGSVFPGPIADTEPDGWGKRVILRDHVKRREASLRVHTPNTASGGALTALDLLLAVDDANRVGALRFRDEQGVLQRSSWPGERTTPPLIELGQLLGAARAVEANEETASDLAYLLGRGTSLGGLRPKCSVVDDDGALAIGKFPSLQDDHAVTKGEVLALTLARAAGIRAAAARLIESDGAFVALIRRFDRRANGGGRVMYVSAATMLGVDATTTDEHAYTEIADAIRVHSADAKADLEELWRRIAFSVLITNTDDHLRNHGFLHVDRSLWQLSPAFDINPSPGRVRELKTWISPDAGPAMSVDGLWSVRAYFGLSVPRAQEILRTVVRAVDGWRETGTALRMTARELDAFAEAFEHPEREAAHNLS